jgi:hypothetical protein
MDDTTEIAAQRAANVAREMMGLGEDASTRHFPLSPPEVAYHSFDEAGHVTADFDIAGNTIDTNSTGETNAAPVQSKTTSERTHFAKDTRLATAVPTSELTPGTMISHNSLEYLVITCPATTSDAVPVCLGAGWTPERTLYLWLIGLATKYADHIGMPPSHRYIFASLPSGYVCGSKLRKDTNTLRMALFGSRSGIFESVGKFWPHFLRLLEDGHVYNCACGLCVKQRKREVDQAGRERVKAERFMKGSIYA